jgi:ABC-type lipoprotein release transport system permease subunit
MLSLAWRNIGRHRWRSVITLSGVAFASALLVFAVALQSGTYETMIRTVLKVQPGHLQIQAEGFLDKKGIRQAILQPEEIVRSVETVAEVAAVSLRGVTVSLISSSERTLGAYVVGIAPTREKTVSSIPAAVREGTYLDEGDTSQAVVGTSLARALRVKVGEEIVLLGEGYDGSVATGVFTVKGLVGSGLPDLDRSLVQIPLATFQEIFATSGAVHEVVVVGRDLARLPELTQSIRRVVPRSQPLAVLPWPDLVPGLQQAVELDRLSNWIFYAILILVVALSLMNTFLMAVLERTREFGVLLSLGMTPRRLMRLVLSESALLTLLGVTLGIGLGGAVTAYFQVHGLEVPGAEMFSQWGLPSRLAPKLSWQSAFAGPLWIFLVTVATATLPVLKIRKLNAVVALRAA